MITLTDTKNKVAKLILIELKEIFTEFDNSTDTIQLKQQDFDNGREQGYVVELRYINNKPVDPIHFAFAEPRNTDGIVVYKNIGYYNNAASCPQSFWDNAKYFQDNEAKEAANYIYDELFNYLQKL